VPDWPAALAALIERRRAEPFLWGQQDCVTFAADDVLALTGQDVLGELRGAWRSLDEAVAVLRREGGLRAAIARRLGAPLPTPRLAQRGDVLLVSRPLLTGCAVARRRLFVAVCDADRFVAPAEGGLVHGPMQAAQTAWGVR
jgi:hypothetical protein